MRRAALVVPRSALLVVLGLACTPAVVDKGADSGVVVDDAATTRGPPEPQGDPDARTDGGDSQGQGQYQGLAQGQGGTGEDPYADLEPVPVDAPAPGRCPATKLREVRYASTRSSKVKMSKEIAALRCVEDADKKLEQDIACAQAFNEASWGHALYEQGLAVVEPSDSGNVGRIRARGAMALGSIHAVPDSPGRFAVYTGSEGSDCSGSSTKTRTSPGVLLAHNAAGEIVVVVPKPTVESRSVARCSCFPGCGAYMEPYPQFELLPEGATIGDTVELSYPAIAITTHAVERQTCCCAP